jgi:hypothetical protein
VNIIDNSLFDLAEFYLNEDRTDDGVTVLERVARETPDREASSMAHFFLAIIHETRIDDPDRARSEYAKVTGIRAIAVRAKVLRPLRAEKRWNEAIDFLKECLAACEEPSAKAKVIRMMISIAKTSRDEKLLEDTLRSVPDLITYEEAKDAAEVDHQKFEELRQMTDGVQIIRIPARDAKRRPAARKDATRKDTARPGRKPAVVGDAAPARPVKSVAEVEAQIRELERAGFHDQARQLRAELKKLKESKNPEQF